MKNLIFCTFLLLLSNAALAQTRLYKHVRFEEITKDHKSIAILPFNATIKLRPAQRNKTSNETLQRMEDEEGKSVQSTLYAWLSKRKGKGSLKVSIQSPQKTLSLLKKAGIEPADYATTLPEKLAEVLGVDAIIMGTYETDQPLSEAASVALAGIIGYFGTTNRALIQLNIYNAEDGELLTNYHKKVSGVIGSNGQQLLNRLMRKASRRIPYNK